MHITPVVTNLLVSAPMKWFSVVLQGHPLEVDLGLPLKDPQTQTKYSEIIRKCLCNLKKVAQGHLVNSRNDQKRRASSNCA